MGNLEVKRLNGLVTWMKVSQGNSQSQLKLIQMRPMVTSVTVLELGRMTMTSLMKMKSVSQLNGILRLGQ